MINLFNQGPKSDPAVMARIKEWVQDIFALSEDTVVMVTELRCAEDDCPDVETVIAILVGPGNTCRHKLLKPADQVAREDVIAIATSRTEV